MTTIDTTWYPRPIAPRTRLRLTTRGRRALAFVVALPVSVAMVIAVISGGSALAGREGGAPEGTFSAVVVAPGDSLWSIAERVAPGADPRDVVDAIVRLNALDGAGLQAGQSLAIPTDYATGR